MNRLQLLFVHNAATRFVEIDRQLLADRYQLGELYLRSRRINPAALLDQVRRHDLVFGWFASWHTFLPLLFAKLLGKPSLLVVGGYDLARLPEIGYGHQRGGLPRLISRLTMRLAGCLVTNAHYSADEAVGNAGIPRERLNVIYHGLPDPFGVLPAGPREPLAITVGNVKQSNLLRKGHTPFVRAAALLPEVEFVLAGGVQDGAGEILRAEASPNVRIAGWLQDAALHDLYRRSAVYVQASLHEGFGMSLAEAMLAGCIPVVTHAGALPEVAGPQAVYLETASPAAIADGIRAALTADSARRYAVREHVLRSFSLERRQAGLEALIQRCLERA